MGETIKDEEARRKKKEDESVFLLKYDTWNCPKVLTIVDRTGTGL
jgi:hypothetical protein